MKKNNAELSRKLVALLLIVGGAAGVFVPVFAWIAMLTHGLAANRRIVALLGLFVFIFGLSTWTGVELWRKKPGAFKWAQVLLIAQVPNLSFAGLAYKFYTGLTLYLSLSQQPDIVTGFEFQLGSDLRFLFGSVTDGFVIGVNLVAIGALYLLAKSRTSLEAKTAAASSSLP